MEQSNYFNELKKLFEKLPGIGPRQASRFVLALLDFSENELTTLSTAIANLPSRLRRCTICFGSFAVKNTEAICSFCALPSRREHTKIMVVEQDSDLANIEKAGLYSGLYHVLGGTIDPMDENPHVRERIKALYARSGKARGKLEIILALSPTKLGEFTSAYITKVLEPLHPNQKSPNPLIITRLGRGLSTGVELEYADELTIKQALDNRK